jgi:hypothetical protein
MNIFEYKYKSNNFYYFLNRSTHQIEYFIIRLQAMTAGEALSASPLLRLHPPPNPTVQSSHSRTLRKGQVSSGQNPLSQPLTLPFSPFHALFSHSVIILS